MKAKAERYWLGLLIMVLCGLSFTSCGDDNESEEGKTEHQTENDGSGTDDNEEEDVSSGSTYVYDNEDEDVEVTWSTSDLVGEWVVCYNLYQEWTDGVLTGQWESDDPTCKYIFSADGSCSFYAGGANVGYEWEGPYTTTWSTSGNVLYIAASSSYSYYTQYYITGLTSDTLCLAYSETYTEDGAACKFRDYFKLVNSEASSGSSTDDDNSDEAYINSNDGVTDDANMVAVDLGLSVKWATCNIGANSPEEWGNYYAWGEIKTKTSYTSSNCSTLTNYYNDINNSSSHDAATAIWGEDWWMPTLTDFEELTEQCTWTWTKVNGIKGYRVTGSTGNSIFLPAAHSVSGDYTGKIGNGSGRYWSSTPYSASDKDNAWNLSFSESSYGSYRYFREIGMSVRPVTSTGYTEDYTGSVDGYDYVDLGLSVKWATKNLGASTPSSWGGIFSWGSTKDVKNTYTSTLTTDNCDTYGKEVDDWSGNASYDAATANMGEHWRTPTQAEMQELIDKCTWKRQSVGGVYGYVFTGPNGNSIFVPQMGYFSSGGRIGTNSAYYWTSMPYSTSTTSSYILHIDDDIDAEPELTWLRRHCGTFIRAVTDY